MKIAYKDNVMKINVKPYDSNQVYDLLTSFGAKKVEQIKSDNLEINTDIELTQQQQNELKAILDTFDMKKTKEGVVIE